MTGIVLVVHPAQWLAYDLLDKILNQVELRGDTVVKCDQLSLQGSPCRAALLFEFHLRGKDHSEPVSSAEKYSFLLRAW